MSWRDTSLNNKKEFNMNTLLLIFLAFVAFGAICVCAEILAVVGGILLAIALPIIALSLL